MKQNNILLALTAAVLSAGCSGFLDKTPFLQLTDTSIFSSPERIEGVVKGVYTQMKENTFIGSKTYACIENMGDDMNNVSGNGYECTFSYNMEVGKETRDNYQTWTGAYLAIQSANTVLENLETAREVVGDSYPKYVQEVKFCRALSYYYLTQLYGKPYMLDGGTSLAVPLRLKAEKSSANNDLRQSTVAEVYAQVLEDTREYAALPQPADADYSINRASQAAVHMLRMRVYMAMEQWQQAIEEGEAIQGYELAPDVTAPFQSNPSCTESIFSFPFDGTNNGGGPQYAACYFYTTGNSLVLDRESGIHSPLYPLYNLPADARTGSLIATASSSQDVLTKFTDKTTYLDWVPVFRYAETLLNLSECYWQTGQEDKAIGALEQVRRRSLAAADDPLDLSTLSGDSLREAICLERRAELVGEAIRALDIKRRCETFVKKKGTPAEFSCPPASSGYTWPIPTIETANNKAIEE